MSNVRRIWSEEEIVEIGARIVISPIMRPLALVARLLFSAKELYFWVNKGGEGAGNLLFTCIRPSCRETGANTLEIDLVLEKGHAPCPEFFLLSKGGFIVVPTILGLKRATVEMELSESGARYQVVYPMGGGAIRSFFKALLRPFSVTAVARQLMEANKVLEARYHELDQARSILALQATQLQTAQTIGALIHNDLDLDRTLATIAKTLIDVAGFCESDVRVHAASEGEGIREPRSARAGAPVDGARALDLNLEGRGRSLGTLRVWARRENAVEQSQLLDTIAPTISMALDNAITYQVVADYRQNLEAKVTERTVELSQAVADLKRAQAARDRIFANINHEIRTPLSLIGLAVEGLLSSSMDGPARDRLTTIDRNARKLLRLVDELLLLASSSEHKLEIRRAPFDLAQLLHLLVGAWHAAAQQHGLSMAYLGPERLVALLDETAVERIVANLLSNAIKFTPRGGTVQVQLLDRLTDAGEIEIIVRDTGIGIDEEFRTRIFGRFEQGRAPVHPGVRGSGIGLSLVKELVEAHGGGVTVENMSAGGSRFRLQLPARPLQLPIHTINRVITPRLQPLDFGFDPTSTTTPRSEPAANGNTRPTILVAEDEPALAEALRALLERDYRVLLASDGLSALELAQKALPDLLLSDVGLPGMDGLELTRRFRALPNNRLAPVILLTAFAGAVDRLSGFDSGAVDYITKPFDPTELIARVRSHLELRALALRLHESEKLAAMGTLAAGLAHELRNPINAIVNAIDPIFSLLPPDVKAPDQPVAQLLDVVRMCSQQVAQLSRQLLGFKRPGHIERHELPFRDVVQRAMSLTSPVLDGIELQDAAQYSGHVYCAAPLMTQVLANLLENAAHAAGAKGWVRMETRAENERLVVEVSDSGPGVPPALRERIFEPFFTTKPPGRGTGLGLSTARDIVNRHQGLLEVRQGASGSVFHLEIPLSGAAE